jgi:DNA replication ATP-dependent helicase Dna2
VASYVYLLDFVIREFPRLTVSHTIGIRLPNLPLQTFNVDMLLQRVEKFFRKDLPRIIETKSPFWHYNSRCRTCTYVKNCREDAKSSTVIIPYLSLENAKHLKKFKPSQEVEVDIEDLVNIFNDLNVDAKDRSMIKGIIKYDKESKSSPYLRAKETGQAQVQKDSCALFYTYDVDLFILTIY